MDGTLKHGRCSLWKNSNHENCTKMKTALITGAEGFIGSHLTEMLVARGYKVKALSQYNSFNNWGWLEFINCKDKIEILTGDVRDPHYCKYITKDVDIIFHLAALIAIPYSYIAPDSYVDTNIKVQWSDKLGHKDSLIIQTIRRSINDTSKNQEATRNVYG